MKNDGGPAFPVAGFVSPYDQQIDPWPTPGMPLRDWFAGKALIGLTSSIRACTDGEDYSPEQMAEYCYECADAMLAERDKP